VLLSMWGELTVQDPGELSLMVSYINVKTQVRATT